MSGTLSRVIMGLVDMFPEVDGSGINGETKLGELPDWDSMAAVNLQVFIEESFHVQVPLDLLNERVMIAEVVKYIEDPEALKKAKRV